MQSQERERARIITGDKLEEGRKSSISAAVEAARRNRHRESEEEEELDECEEELKEARSIEDMVTQVN